MSEMPNCPKCSSTFVYEDRDLLVCPECGHEWSLEAASEEPTVKVWKDANGNVLEDGDTISFDQQESLNDMVENYKKSLIATSKFIIYSQVA
mgnify:CR=1 FL=1